MAERTEPASPRRRREQRRRGEVPVAPEAVAVAALAGALLAAGATVTRLRDAFGALLAVGLRAAATPHAATPVAPALARALALALPAAAPVLGAAALGAVLAGALQTGFLFSPRAAAPRPERLSPLAALARYRRARTWLDPLLQLAYGAALVTVGVLAARDLLAAHSLVPGSPQALVLRGGALARGLGARLVAAGALVTVTEVLRRRWLHASDTKMTREEVRREQREEEGAPEPKRAHRERHREILGEAPIEAVATASFVVAAPNHATALRYVESETEAPVVIVRGEGATAQRIVEEAERCGVPVVIDDTLAGALAGLTVGAEIPAAHYESVAAVVRELASTPVRE